MFQRLYRKNEDELPPSTPLQTQRKRQIENIRTNYKNATEVVSEIDYRIPITVGNLHMTLMILLPPHFPQDGPTIHVSPSVVHPWVNKEQQIVGCLSLKNFTMHSDLGKTIQDIIEEFNQRPPVLDSLARHDDVFEHPLTAYPHDPTAMIGRPYIPVASYKEIRSFDILMDPGYHFPELSTLSTRSLEDLNNDDQKLEDFIDALPSHQHLNKEVNLLQTENEILAYNNVEKQPQIQIMRERLAKKIDIVTAQKAKFDEQNRYFQRLTDQYSSANICENLKIATVQAEEESDVMATNFLDGKMEVDQFLAVFLERRTLYHLRRIKEEKLQVQVNEFQKYSQ